MALDEGTTVETPAVESAAPAQAPAAEPAAPAAPVSRRETIEALVKGKPAEPAPAAKAAEPTAAPAAEPKADTRPRDDLGRFKTLPKSWKKELAPKFEAIDPDIQAEVHRREDDIFKGIEQYKGKAQVAAEFEAAMQPYMQTIQSLGVTPAQAVQTLMSTDHKLRFGTQAQKQAVVMDIIRNYGVEFDPANPPAQPDAAQLELARINEELRTLKQAQEQSTLAPYLNAVNQFRSDPAHAHYDRLEAHILSLISTGAARDLADAYDQALWAHPELRQEALAQQRAAEQKAEAERVAAARAAAVQVRGAPAQAVPREVNRQDRRAVIQAALANLQR